jgi:hypothetical protein
MDVEVEIRSSGGWKPTGSEADGQRAFMIRQALTLSATVAYVPSLVPPSAGYKASARVGSTAQEGGRMVWKDWRERDNGLEASQDVI